MDQADMAHQTALTLCKTPFGLITPYQTDYGVVGNSISPLSHFLFMSYSDFDYILVVDNALLAM
jgi:hypothetical protein